MTANRTSAALLDRSVPNRTRYQAAPRPDGDGYASDESRSQSPFEAPRHGGVKGKGSDPTGTFDRNAYQREWVAARRAEFFAGKSCEKCGATANLELDHLDPAQKESHKIWSWSPGRRDAEIAKCRILCNGCHVQRHADMRRKPLEHGTANAYKKRGCRCDLCRAWNAKYKNELRAAAHTRYALPRAA